MRDLAQLRTPGVPLARGLYESLYLTATAPEGDRALWLRHTWLKVPGQPAEPVLWVTWWGPRLVQTRGPGTAELTASSSRGALGAHAWDLSWSADHEPVPYLPKGLYDKSFPRSNAVLLVPHGTVDGTFDGVDLSGWSAVVGHNWGAEHAHEWEWLHGSNGDDWFDQLRVKPVRLAPWLTLATTCIGGQTNRSRRPMPVDVTWGSTVEWDYASPKGRDRSVRNSSVASAVLEGRTFHATVERGS
ncbi:MAG: hypothetical protein JWN31_1791 [Frankiales bacterium]|nr:hypothetical protein [Frankiales bacterium]